MRLCLNMIVKNEAACIARCLDSVVDFIDAAVIVDTGSADGTPDLIRESLKHAGIPYEIHHVPFENFAQARNAALAAARLSPLEFDYLLLMDADMELVVHDPKFAEALRGASYEVNQRSGSLVYANTRILNRYAPAEFIGVTHEFLSAQSVGSLSEIEFIDHADGANRKDKYARDATLLEDALKKEPTNGRYWFYLGQTYRDAALPRKSLYAYREAVKYSTWDEERWNAQLNVAHQLKAMGDENGFVGEALKAYQMRPTRAETLYDLAHFFRQKDNSQNISTLFSEAALGIPMSSDRLFVNEFAHNVGPRQEFAITSFYDERKRAKGFKVCDELTLDATVPAHVRHEARDNLFWYIRPITDTIAHTFRRPIPFIAPNGYVAMNPSIIYTRAGHLMCVVRCVNYTISESGHYLIRATDGSITNDNPIHTRNFIVQIDPSLEKSEQREIIVPDDFPAPKYGLVRGFEDMRLFEVNGELWVSACVREQNEEGWCEQFVACLDMDGETCQLGDWMRVLPESRCHEKNWMPFMSQDRFRFVHRPGVLIDVQGTMSPAAPASQRDFEHLSGGSQVIQFRGCNLCIMHEARERPDNKQRYYLHRFVLLNPDATVLRISRPFVLHDRQIEFVAGLAFDRQHDRLVISYGVRDQEAWIMTIDADEVMGVFYA